MKRLIPYIAVLAVAVVACQEKEMPSPKVQDAPVFHAILDEVTKAGFDYDALNKIYEHYWNNGDEVAIFQKGNKYDKYEITNAATGTLEMVSAHAGDHDYTYEHNYAVFPYSAVSSGGSADRIYVTLPADSPVYNASSPIYGYENILLGEGDDENLTFKSYVGWLKVSLKGDFKVKNIRLSGNGGEHLAASGIIFDWGFWYTPEVSSYTYSFADMGIGGSFYDARNLRFEAPYPQLSGTATDFYFAIRGDFTLTTGYTLVITKEDDSTVTLVNRSPVTIKPNKVSPTAPISVSDYVTVSAATGLGSESANCYVVSAAGTYRFPTVKGNSFTSVGAVASAEVLWETDNTFTAVSVGDIIESVNYNPMGYILFSTPAVFKEGNALIAAKDSEGNILWSWHIWCTDEPSYTTLTYDGTTTTFMDRNLGALSATKGDGLATFGLYYAWGRKDPFYIERSATSSNDFARVRGTVSLPTASYAEDSKATVAYVTAHPTEWVASGDGSSFNNPWFAENPANPFWSNTKTIYDPCPPGYVTYNDNTTDSNILYKLRQANDKTSFGGSGNFPYMTLTDGTNEIWFPFCGYANPAENPTIFAVGGLNMTYRGSYWMGYYNTTPFDGRTLYFQAGAASDLSNSWFTVSVTSTQPAKYLYAVRCQKQ